MKTTLNKTALLLIMILILESLTSAISFADTEFDVSSEEQEVVSEDAPQDDAANPEGVVTDDANKDDSAANPDSADDGNDSDATDDTGAEVEPEPEVLNGWVSKNDKTYYYVDGVYVTGMQKIEGAWYFFGKKGSMRTGFITIEKKKYYFDPDDGKRVRGNITIDGSVYYFRKNGQMTVGWLKRKGKTFYHDADGKRLFGNAKIGKYKYFFSMKSGAMKKGWLKLKGKHYYFNKKGHKLFGIKKIGRKTYYLNLSTGARMAKGKYFLYKKVWNLSSSTKYLVYIDKKGKWVNVYKGRKKHWTLIRRNRCTIGAGSTPTPSGTFKVTSKVYHFGEQKGYTCWYATGFIGVTYLMHSVVCYRGTKVPSDGRLGAAVSHGCVRMKISNAKWIYDHIPHGSTVYIS